MASSEVQSSSSASSSAANAAPATAGGQADLVKHPLQHEWTLWYYEPDKAKKWEENLNMVSKFATVEDFWSLFTHIKQPSEVRMGSDYSLFKDDIRPMWEDKANKNGGIWRLTLMPRQKQDLDRYWIDTVLCLIGEAFDNYSNVCGATVNIRPKGDRICLWTSDYQNEEAVVEIGRKFKAGLSLPERFKIHYSPHSESMNRGSSNLKYLFEV